MKPIFRIRSELGLSQAAFAAGIGVTQGNVSHYEKGQTVPPNVAARVIEFAASRGKKITFDDVYRGPTQPAAQQDAA